jgi:hypothetical protein
MDSDICEATETENKGRVHLSGYGNGSVSIAELSPEEVEKMCGVFNAGAYWARVVEGRLVLFPAWKKLPDPIHDEEMLPFWRTATEGQTFLKLVSFDEDRLKNSSPSIQIQSLCGYFYTPENYKKNAERLLSYGFEVMRSKRGNDGKYCEIWYLSSLWCAKGDLENAVNRHKSEKDKLEAALEFLRTHVSFGTLDVCVQRLAMVMDESE